MTRHRRHTWQQTTAYGAAAVLLSGDALAVDTWAMRTYNGALVLTSIALGIAAGVAALAAGAFALSIGWHRGRQRVLIQDANGYTPGPAYPSPASTVPDGPTLAEAMLINRLAAEGRTGPWPVKPQTPATAAAAADGPSR